MVSNTKPSPIYGRPGIDGTIETTPGWHQWFAWHPVKVNGRLTWLKTVYRRRKSHSWQRDWQYGTAFDVIKGDESTNVGQNPPKPPPRYVK